MKEKAVIIGAGMSGCFMGLVFAGKDFDVEIYEARSDVRKYPYDSGRSFNLTLYTRGIMAMQKMDIWDEIKKHAILAEGNVAHYKNKRSVFSSFDATGNEVLYTIHRNQLNSILIDIAEKSPNIKFFFGAELLSVDESNKSIELRKDGKKFDKQFDILVGADGVNSVVRKEMKELTKLREEIEYEDWGYKEVHVSAEKAAGLNLRKLSTHTWPRSDSLLIAFPNPDSSFTLMFNLPLDGKNSFFTLNSKQEIKNYIKNHFPDLVILLPEITDSFLNKPTGNFVTVKTSPWYYKDSIVLIGDSAHGVTPFYGQGVSAAFDDCLTIKSLIDDKNDWEGIFREYQALRKKDTDVIAHLAKENFIELRDKSRSSYYILKDKADTLLHRMFPKLWLPPLYILIAHGTQPYSVALETKLSQGKIAKWSGLNLLLRIVSLPISVAQKIRGTLDL